MYFPRLKGYRYSIPNTMWLDGTYSTDGWWSASSSRDETRTPKVQEVDTVLLEKLMQGEDARRSVEAGSESRDLKTRMTKLVASHHYLSFSIMVIFPTSPGSPASSLPPHPPASNTVFQSPHSPGP